MLLINTLLIFCFLNTIELALVDCDSLVLDVDIKNIGDDCETISALDEFYLDIHLNFKDKTDDDLTVKQEKLGFYPKVIVFEKQQSKTNQHFIDTFFVSKTKRCPQSMYIDKRKCVYTPDRSLNDSSLITKETSNDLYWNAILPVSNMTDFMEVTVYSNDIGIKVPKKTIMKYFRRSSLEKNRFLFKKIEKKVLLLKNRTLNIKKGYYGDWSVILEDNFMMVSNSEYNDIRFMKIDLNFKIQSEPVVCHDAVEQEIFEVLLLEDEMLVSTKYGLVKLPYNESENAQVVFSKCVSSLSFLGQTPQNIIAVDKKNKQLVYWDYPSLILTGNENLFNFTNLLGKNYDLIDVATLNEIDHIVLLLRQEIDKKYVFKIAYITRNINSWGLDVRSIVISNEMKKLSLTYFFYVYVWGKAIYCSLDAGHHFSRIEFDSSDEVINLWNSNLNTFVFQTSSFDLWFGICETAVARKLTLSPIKHFTPILYYFDSHGEFKEMNLNDRGPSVCLNSRTIDIAFEHFVNADFNRHGEVSQCCYHKKFNVRKHKDDILHSHCYCAFNGMEVTTEQFKKFSRTLTFRHTLRNTDSVNQLSSGINHTTGNNFIERYTTNSLTLKEINKSRVDDIFSTFTAISLGLLQCFNIDINMELAYTYNTKKYYNKYWTIDDFRIDFYTPYDDYLEIKVDKIKRILDGMITFQTSVCDRGYFRGRILPGEYFMNTFVQFHVKPWELECTSSSKLKNVALKIRHGCSSRKRMKIDFEQSHGLVNSHCDRVNCFLYEYPFNPVFYLDDEITGSIEVYKGLYNMTIIAGGETVDSLIHYTDEQINDYNFKLGSPARIWSWLNPGKPTDGHQWLCSMTSPCAKIYPGSFGGTSKYFFLVRFKNENNNSNCDYSFDFMLKLHGMNPDSLHHALPIIIVSSILSMAMFSLIFHIETKYRRNILAMQRSVLHGIRKFLSVLDGKNKTNKIEPLEIIHEHSAVRLKVEDWSRKLTFEDQVSKIEPSPPSPIIIADNTDIERQSIGTSMTSLRGNIGTSMTSLHLRNGLLSRPVSQHNFNSLNIAPDSY